MKKSICFQTVILSTLFLLPGCVNNPGKNAGDINKEDSLTIGDQSAPRNVTMDSNAIVMAHVISKDGTKISYEKTGSGPSIIIVSGALSQRSIFPPEALQLVEMLSNHFTVITYDRRGRGESSDTPPYSVEREIEDIEALIIHAAGEKSYLYGVSSGAALSLQTAAELGPSRVPKLAIFEPPYGQPKEAFQKQNQGVKDLVKTGNPGDAATFFMTENGTPPEVFEKIQASPAWETMKQIDFTLVYDYEVLGDGMIPQKVVQSVSIPTLVMDGEKSMDFMHATADQITKLLPDGQHETLKGQMHSAAPNVVGPILIKFFQQ